MLIEGSRARSREKPEPNGERTTDTTTAPLTIIGLDAGGVPVSINHAPTSRLVYNVPLKLSAPAPSDRWCDAFEAAFKDLMQDSSSSPGVVSVYGDRIIVFGNSLNTIASGHRDALLMALKVANSVP